MRPNQLPHHLGECTAPTKCQSNLGVSLTSRCIALQAAGCKIVTGDTMFVGQAATQFKIFTGKEAPVGLMQQVVLDSLK